MLSSITPFGERGRHNRFGVTAAAHTFGAAVGGAALGALAGAVGAVLEPSATTRGVVLAAAAAAAAVLDLRVGGLLVPTVHRQVNEDWLGAYRGWVYGAGFGVQLGLGVVTVVTSAAVYLVVVMGVLSGSVAAGAAIGAAFGLVRGGAVFAVAGVRDPASLRTFHRHLHERAALASRSTIAVETIVAVVAVASLVNA